MKSVTDGDPLISLLLLDLFYSLPYCSERPFQVRPEEVLEKALAMVETSQKNYFYKCDQLKSVRQDLTVQRIQNELTVKVVWKST